MRKHLRSRLYADSYSAFGGLITKGFGFSGFTVSPVLAGVSRHRAPLTSTGRSHADAYWCYWHSYPSYFHLRHQQDQTPFSCHRVGLLLLNATLFGYSDGPVASASRPSPALRPSSMFPAGTPVASSPRTTSPLSSPASVSGASPVAPDPSEPMLYSWANLNASGSTKRVVTTATMFVFQCAGNVSSSL